MSRRFNNASRSFLSTSKFDLKPWLTYCTRAHQRCPVHAVWDGSVSSLRLTPHPEEELPVNLEAFEALSREVDLTFSQREVRMPEQHATPPKVPRPPNSFILYRQNHHKEITAANLGVPNTEICKLAIYCALEATNNLTARIIAKMWREETEEVRAHWTDMAEQIRQQHVNEHPDYVYSPRKHDEIPRRKSKLSGEQVSFIGNTTHGEEHLRTADNQPDSMVTNLDSNFVEAAGNQLPLHASNGVDPQLVSAVDDFYQLLRDQFERVPMRTGRFEPMDTNELSAEFPMEDLLNFPGAT